MTSDISNISESYQKFMKFIEMPVDNRIKESKKIRSLYPDRVPVVVYTVKNTGIPDNDKIKYLVPLVLTLGQFQFVVRKRSKIESEKAMFMCIDGNILPQSSTIDSIYDEYKNDDGFLYISISGENTFG